MKVRRAAENVRTAQLAILKAEQELIRYDSESGERARHIAAIGKRLDAWQNMSVEEIIQQYSAKPSISEVTVRRRQADKNSWILL